MTCLDAILEGYVEQGLEPDGAGAPRSSRDRRRRGRPDGGSRRVQATSGAGGHQDHSARLRSRPAHADNNSACLAAARRPRRGALALAAAAAAAAAAGPAKDAARSRRRRARRPPRPAASGARRRGAAPAGDVRRHTPAARRPGPAGRARVGRARAARGGRLEPDARRSRAARASARCARPGVAGAEWSLARESGRAPAARRRRRRWARRRPSPTRSSPRRAVGPAVGAAGLGRRPHDVRPPARASRSSTAAWTRRHEEWAGPATPLVAPRSTCSGDDDATDGGDSRATAPTWPASPPPRPTASASSASRPRAAGRRPRSSRSRSPTASGESSDLTHDPGHPPRRRQRRQGREHLGRRRRATRAPSRTPSSGPPAQGALIVASVGNEGDGENGLNYPAAYRARRSGVGAQCDDQISPDCPRPFGVAGFSNHNRSVDVIAPGVNVRLERAPARHGARGAARLRAEGRHLDVGAVRVRRRRPGDGEQRRTRSARTRCCARSRTPRRTSAPRGRDDASGYGVVNPRAAVTLHGARATTPTRSTTTSSGSRERQAPGAEGQPLDVEATRRPLRRPRRRLRREHAPRRAAPGDAQVPARRGRPLPLEAGHHDGPDRQARRSAQPHPLPPAAPRKTKTIVYTAKKNGRHFVNVYARSGDGPTTPSPSSACASA